MDGLNERADLRIRPTGRTPLIFQRKMAWVTKAFHVTVGSDISQFRTTRAITSITNIDREQNAFARRGAAVLMLLPVAKKVRSSFAPEAININASANFFI
jgi:hypothetical protein